LRQIALWNRRKFLKTAVTGLVGTTGIFAFLNGFKKINNIGDIVEYPSPILRSVSQSIDLIDESIITLGNSMISILRYHAPFEFFFKGSLYKGLAAPQVGVQKRLIVCGLYGEIKILINPEILEQNGMYSNSEYCLSLPRYDRKTIKRSQNVRVKYKTLENTEKILVAKNSPAALLQHEIDHLNGILYIDY
jgi:peptide deformylase